MQHKTIGIEKLQNFNENNLSTPSHRYYFFHLISLTIEGSLQWRHQQCDGVSNHRHLDFFRDRFLQAQIKENIKALRHWPLCWELPVTGGFPHKRPVTRKMFPLENVTMITRNWNNRRFYCLEEINLHIGDLFILKMVHTTILWKSS